MSSYRGVSGAWDGGPPGAEADYAGRGAAPYGAPPAHGPPMPTTDPWTGVSYSQYGSMPAYDYQAYGAASYGYNYDSSYYPPPPPPPGDYYGKYPEPSYQAPPRNSYEPPPRPRDRTRSPVDARKYDRHRSRTKSRSVSPYRKERSYSRKRHSSPEEGSRRRRSRSTSKHRKYSSSECSRSHSRSYSRSSIKKERNVRKSVSTDSSTSDRSYKKKKSKNHGRVSRRRSPSGSRSRSRSGRTPSINRSISKSPRKESVNIKKTKSHSSKDKKQKDTSTPPKKRNDSITQKVHIKTERSSLTPPKSYQKPERSVTPSIKKKIKVEKSSPLRKVKESSLTPPRSYARRSRSSSKSSSKSPSPRRAKTKRSRRSRSQSSSKSGSLTPPRSKSKRDTKKKTNHRSRSKSRSKRSSLSKSRSTSRHSSKSRSKGNRSISPKDLKSRSKSRSSRSRSQSGSGTPSDDERRGQFTVADRKRYWKMHRNKHEKDEKAKTPPKEVLPPPGAVESTRVDDIEYGDPPELEGPNFADLLPTPDQVLRQASTSKPKPGGPLPIKNDGSFLEMFKKMQEATKKAEAVEKKPEIKKPVLPFIGKRRGGRVLKTGLVKKAKAIDEQTADNTPKDAWSLYMQEVKKYRETSCEEERKTRPLVK